MNNFAWIFVTITITGLVIALIVLSSKSVQKEREILMETGLLAEAEILGYERDEVHVVHYRFVPMGKTKPVECKKRACQDFCVRGIA
ncbi:hypothetical protein G8A07_01275 [Roseateles sp. DAIF2]|uniref:hypothetical protein n=1 Tax=Roseateles sp. DAIF2 TaxID=2714952 RepID=UPI0018A31C4F|nr:hypothetical protein [Roseateles sp. DAIF2]QPF71692.1 hypothetical protein G8A07_01275 [Roseateles sp. DAIF2]